MLVFARPNERRPRMIRACECASRCSATISSPWTLSRMPGNASKRQLFFNPHAKLPQLQTTPASRSHHPPYPGPPVPRSPAPCQFVSLYVSSFFLPHRRPVPQRFSPAQIHANGLCVFVAPNPVLAVFCGDTFFQSSRLEYQSSLRRGKARRAGASWIVPAKAPLWMAAAWAAGETA